MEDTAVDSLAAGSVRTVVDADVVGTDLWLTGHQLDLELDRAGVAGPEEADPHGPGAVDGMSAGREMVLTTHGAQSRVHQGRVLGVILNGEDVVEAASVNLHVHGGHHDLSAVHGLHVEGALDLGAVGVEGVAVGDDLDGVVVGGEVDGGGLLRPPRAVVGPQVTHHVMVLVMMISLGH